MSFGIVFGIIFVFIGLIGIYISHRIGAVRNCEHELGLWDDYPDNGRMKYRKCHKCGGIEIENK